MLGAVFSFLLIALIYFDISLWKRYAKYVKSKDETIFGEFDLLLFGLINAIVIWFAFTMIASTFVKYSGVSVSIGIIAACIFLTFTLYSCRKLIRLPKMANISLNIRKTPKHTERPITDVSKEITKFNYFYSFDFLPRMIEEINAGKFKIELFAYNQNLPKEYNEIAANLKFKLTESQSPKGQLLLINVPSTGAVSEAAMAAIFFSPEYNTAFLITCENSIGSFILCEPLVGKHTNLGIIVNKPSEALGEILTIFSHRVESIRKTKGNQSADEDKTYEPTPTTDIYGDSLLNNTDSIYDLIKASSQWLFEQAHELPLPSEEGKLECQIIIASVAATRIEIGIVAQSLISGDRRFHNLGITYVLKKLEYYKEMYEKFVKQTYMVQKWPLLEFAKLKGKLKICDNPKALPGTNPKFPAFRDNADNVTVCSFGTFDDSQRTPEFIQQHKDDIIVKEYTNGRFVFWLKEYDRQNSDLFDDMLSYQIFCAPLSDKISPSEKEIYKGLQDRHIILSSQNQAMGYAFAVGSDYFLSLANSYGLI